MKIDAKISKSKSTIIKGHLKSDVKPDIVLLAHLDSQFFSPGAHDDASGVLCLTEILRLLQREPIPLSLEFVFTTGHEHDGDGEKLMVDKLNEENISLNYFFNIDGIGHKFIQDQISFYNINNALESEILQLQKNYDISKGPQ